MNGVSASTLNFYKELKGIYNSGDDKEENKRIILEHVSSQFAHINSASTATATSPTQAINLFELKVLMESQFIRDVKCSYTYLFTPDKFGCDLRELVFNVLEPELRPQLLQNIEAHATKKQIPHILTDIDDTLFPNFNGFIETMGSDTSWKSHAPYPGIKKFYEIFHRNIPIPIARYTTVLTGTPTFFKGHRLTSPNIVDILGKNFGFMQGFDKKRHAVQAMLLGVYEHGPHKFAVSSTYIAAVKYEKFMQYRQLFPEYKLLFIGDNGQGDLIAGKQMIESDPTTLVFIHNILKHSSAFLLSDAQERDEQRNSDGRLFFFKNYLELADIFRALGYFSPTDFSELRVSVSQDIRRSHYPLSPGPDPDPYFFHYACPIQKPSVCLTPEIVKQSAGKTKRKKHNKRRTTRKNVPV